MFVRTTPSGKRVAVGSGVPKDWTPGPPRSRRPVAKKVEPAEEPATKAEGSKSEPKPEVTFKTAQDKKE